ncbi:Mediator of rna polymerase ii transcription subunit 15a, partial [Thalictrum thalictroides]
VNSSGQTGLSDKSQRAKIWLEHAFKMFDACSSNIPRGLTEDKLLTIEKQIVDFIKAITMRRKVLPQQQGQQQIQAQMQHTDNQMKTSVQTKNLKNSVTTVQPSAVVTLQHDYMPSQSSYMGVPDLQPNLMNTLQSSSHSHSVHGNALHSSHQGVVGTSQKIPMNAAQQARNNLYSQNEDAWQHKDTSLQPNSYHSKPQSQPRQKVHQLVKEKVQKIMQQNQQNLLQQNTLKQKLQQSTELLGHQIPQSYQTNIVSNIQGKQSINVNSGVFQQPQTTGRQSAYNELPAKHGVVSNMSSPYPLLSSSPYASQYSSPQTDQLSMISLSKSEMPLKPASSPMFSLSPSTSLTQSPILVDHDEKQTSSISSHSNVGNCKQMQIDTSGAVNIQGSASPIVSSITIATEKPIERLIRAVKSMSQNALNASVSDIHSAISMVDRMAGSKPGNHSMDAIGENLVATVKHRAVMNNFLHDNGIISTENMKYHTNGMPLRLVASDGSVNDSFKPCNGMEKSVLESTATSRTKRPRVEV